MGETRIRKWVLLIDGFGKSPANPSGLDVLWMNLRSLARPDVAFLQFNWWDDFRGWARRIKRLSVAKPEIFIVPYSWGFGHGTLKLCRHFGKLDLRVNTILATDPVYCSYLAPWRGLMSFVMEEPEIPVPWNVDRAVYFTQRMKRPYGHHLVRSDVGQSTLIEHAAQLNYPHANMDAAPEFFDRAQDMIRSFVRQPVAEAAV